MAFTYKMPARKHPETGEFIVRCWKDGKRYPAGDAFESTMEDAQGTFDCLTERHKDKSRWKILKEDTCGRGEPADEIADNLTWKEALDFLAKQSPTGRYTYLLFPLVDAEGEEIVY